MLYIFSKGYIFSGTSTNFYIGVQYHIEFN